MAAEPTDTPRYGVTGDPVAHSRSPQMHEAAYRELGIDAVYQRLPLPSELFAETVRALPQSGFRGINVTIPHKQAAATLADTRSEAVQAIGAANTLIFNDGQIAAENTDAPGLIAALGGELGGREVLVLGAGGTARAAVWALKDAGAVVTVHNRTTARGHELADQFGVQFSEDTRGGAGFDVIVNTTSVGMQPDEDRHSVLAALRLDTAVLNSGLRLVDFVYRDGGSPLTLEARAHGAEVVDGLDLLARQGALSFELWFGRPAPFAAMRTALG